MNDILERYAEQLAYENGTSLELTTVREMWPEDEVPFLLDKETQKELEKAVLRRALDILNEKFER